MNLNLKEIPLNELYPLIHGVFSLDHDLAANSQMVRPSAIKMSKRCYHDVIALARKFQIKCFAVIYNQQAIGFTVLCYAHNDLLYSFGIDPEYRKKDILLAWLEVIKAQFNREWYVPLSCNNKRAIAFFEKNGFNNKHIDTKLNQLLLWQ